MANEYFLNKYNLLDSTLKYLIGSSDGKNLIYTYEKTLPDHKRALLEEIRKFKNTHESHGVSNKTPPEAPQSWITFLNEQIYFIKNHKELVKRKVLIELSHESKPQHQRSIGPRQKKEYVKAEDNISLDFSYTDRFKNLKPKVYCIFCLSLQTYYDGISFNNHRTGKESMEHAYLYEDLDLVKQTVKMLVNAHKDTGYVFEIRAYKDLKEVSWWPQDFRQI